MMSTPTGTVRRRSFLAGFSATCGLVVSGLLDFGRRAWAATDDAALVGRARVRSADPSRRARVR